MAIGTLLLQGNLEDRGHQHGDGGRDTATPEAPDIYTGTWTSPPQEHLKLDEDIRDNTTPGASGEHRQGDRDGVTTTLRDLAHREDTGMGTPPPQGHLQQREDISMETGTSAWGWGHHNHPGDNRIEIRIRTPPAP